MKLDYTALTQPVTTADIAVFEKTQPPKRFLGLTSKTQQVIAAVIVVAAVINVLLQAAFDWRSGLSTLLFIGPILAVVSGWLFVARQRAKKLARLYKFAHANQLRLLSNQKEPGYVGMIFDEGRSQKIREALVFPEGMEIGNYQYVTGSGKHQQTHSWGYVRIPLTRRLPHMVLDSQQNNFLSRFSNLPDSFDRNQTLALEGDFNQHFTLYAPRQYERDALYVFTPDVMAAVIDASQAYDMEVIDDTLLLYNKEPFKLESHTQLQLLLGVVETISGELRDQSRRYADERVGNPAANIVAEPGRRLETKLSLGTIVVIVVAVLYVVLGMVG